MAPVRLTLLLASLVCGLFGALAPPAAAQVANSGPDIQLVGEDEYLIQFDETEGEKLEDFIHLAKNLLLIPIQYSPQEVNEQRIRIVGPQRVRRESFFEYFQAVLKTLDFIIVPMGPEDGSILRVQRVTGQGRTTIAAKALAPVVGVDELVNYRREAGTLITTSIPLKHVDARSVMATFQQLVDATIESVRNVENSNSLVITGFGQHVWGVYQLVQLIDVPPFQATPAIVKRELDHASVDELIDVVTELLGASRGLRAGQTAPSPQQAGGAPREIEPRVIAEPRSNSLLITGDEQMVAQIEGWIDVLDVEVEARGNTHVIRLKNTNAIELEEVLREVLNAEQQGAQGGRAGAAGVSGGGAGGNALEIRPDAIADEASNSLVITASDRKFAEIVELVRELDVRPRQVLLEAAIVETFRSLDETFAVGLAAGDFDDGAFVSNFNTSLGITGGTDDGGAATGVAGAAAGTAGAGGTVAVFNSTDFPVPFLLNVIESDAQNDVLSRPYLLTNDNQEASIRSELQTSFQTFTTNNAVTNAGFEQIDAGIELRVSPSISAGNYLRLDVFIEVSDFAPSSNSIEGAPPDRNTRIIETPVTLPDGHTVILGGLVSETSADSEAKYPWLGDLPGIGWLFRSTTESATKRYLYVFITPHIIDTDFALLDEISELRRRELERLSGDIQDLALMPPSLDGDGDLLGLETSDLDMIFSMPTPALPASGDWTAPPTTAGGTTSGSGTKSFDEVFGFDNGSGN